MACKDPSKQQFHFITMNMHKEKHADLIEWLKSTAEDEEQSLSSLCIKLLKQTMKLAREISDEQFEKQQQEVHDAIKAKTTEILNRAK